MRNRKRVLGLMVAGMLALPAGIAQATPPDNRPPANRPPAHGGGGGGGGGNSQSQQQGQEQSQCFLVLAILTPAEC